MSRSLDRMQARQAKLDRLEELELSAVEAAHARYIAAIDTDAEAEKARTYHRAARSLRQTLALNDRFDRFVDQLERGLAADARRQDLFPKPEPRRRLFPKDIAAADQRSEDLRTGVRRIIWSEGFEASDFESERELEGYFYRSLEDWLVEDRLEDDFTDKPLDDHIAELAKAFGLNPANVARWRDLPDPPDDRVQDFLDEDHDDTGTPAWRSG